MERDNPRHECNESTQYLPKTPAAFWGKQLEQIKERAERQAGRTSACSTSDGRCQLGPGCNNGN
jgi:hypothetical protein